MPELLAVGTEITLHGLTRPLDHSQLAWLHGALSRRLGRDHGVAPSWSVMPWPSQSGAAVVWWRHEDGLSLARTRARSRIGRRDVELELGSPVRIHMPERGEGARLRVTTMSPVSIASLRRRGPHAGERVAHEHATSQGLTSALRTVASKIGVTADPVVTVLHDETRPSSVRIKGKLGAVRGWEGACEVEANADAAWLLHCAGRGLGLGARTAFGFGAVKIQQF